MANYNLLYFGQLDSDNLEDFYDLKVDLEGKQIDNDLNFDGVSVNVSRLECINQFFGKLNDFDKKKLHALVLDYENGKGDTVKSYVEHLVDLADTNDATAGPEIQLLNKLHLARVGSYPDNEEYFAVFDYTIGRHETNYLIALYANEEGTLTAMSMES